MISEIQVIGNALLFLLLKPCRPVEPPMTIVYSEIDGV
jgi:hypothetical protein